MPRGVRIRLLIFSFAILGAMAYLIPNFVDNLPSWWSRFLPTQRIHLGLDLQGGTHLILEVKVDRAVENAVEQIRAEMREVLRQKGIGPFELERVQTAQLQLRTPSDQAEKVREVLKNEFPGLTILKAQPASGRHEFTLAMKENEIRDLRDYAVEQSIQTIRNRIDQFGVNEPLIQRRGQQDILIQLPGIQDPERAKEIIGKTALLEFKLVDESHSLEEALQKGPPPGVQILYGVDGRDKGTGGEKVPYLLEVRTLMTGEYIVNARVRPSSGLEGPYVELILNTTGTRLFEKITAENVNRRLAIVLDNRVYSAPTIKERIGGGRASITGSFDIKEARDLAIILRAGALPAPVEIIEERTVGPSLGRDSIRQGITSFVVGSALVIIFMIAYYKGAGLVADMALLVNVLFMLAILAGFEAVLTLPGIAGIVLTMGMAVDANVLINERIREEQRVGKSPRAAVEAGYEKALPAILDSNITTFLSGVILFQFGTGPIRGFAVTLCVGIVTTVITAVYLTRTYYDYRLTTRKLARISI